MSISGLGAIVALALQGFGYTSSGPIEADETWEGEVLLTGDVVVQPGVKLVIRA